MPKNILYYGDNLKIMREHIPDESVDLVYLDPPFNSNQDYNVLFAEKNGSDAAAQIKAFEDTWRWDQAAAEVYHYVVEKGPSKVSLTMQAFQKMLGYNDMLAYLAMMAPRLLELHRVLKTTGSIFLHCDPTASHYLKILLDAIFSPKRFQNEIIWKRTSARSDSHRYNQIHDVILFYSKSEKFCWNLQYSAYDPHYIETFYRHVDPDTGRRYRLSDLTAAGKRKGSSGLPWRGVDPGLKGNHWKYTIENLEKLDQEGRIYWPSKGKVPCYKRYLDEMSGLTLQSIWTDIPPIGAHARERLGYQTQKPELLLERVIKSSSKEGDIVLDPFCGCGTTIIAAHKLKRRWIGIDITHLAITLMKNRLQDTFGEKIKSKYEVIGEPESLPDAETLAKDDPYQFQWWALSLVSSRPVNKKKGMDKGIDGRLFFHDDPKSPTKQIVISVKSGHTGAAHLRDLLGVMGREKAEIGVLITLQNPTRDMKAEAAGAGFYESPTWHSKHPRLQILTIEELFKGQRIDYPPPTQVNVTFKKAQRKNEENNDKQNELNFEQ